MSTTGSRRASAPAGERRRRQLPRWASGALLLLLVLAAGCYNNNTGETRVPGVVNMTLPAFPETGGHAVEVFTEMHFQPVHRSQESPRLLPPPDSVPVTGREIKLTVAELKDAPVPRSAQAAYDADPGRAATLFSVNCAVCHGESRRGDGAVAAYITRGPKPADLTLAVTRDSTDGELFGFISGGGRQGVALTERGLESQSPMPEFQRLLTEEERWSLVLFLRSPAPPSDQPDEPEPPPPDEPDEPKPPPSGECVTSVEVTNKDVGGSGVYEFDPSELTFCAGDTVEFTVIAETEFHTFTVDELGIDEVLDAGETITFSFTFEDPGEYRLYCIPHGALGMEGTIRVQ